RHRDRGPIFPEIETVMPGIAEGAHDLRIAQHDVALAARMPGNAVDGDVTPVLVRELPKGCQHFAEIGLRFAEIAKLDRHCAQVAADAGKPRPRQERTDVIDDEAADGIAGEASEHDADQAAERSA